MKFYLRVACVLGVFQFAKSIECLIKGEICDISRVFPGHFHCMRGPSMVELTGHDNRATLA